MIADRRLGRKASGASTSTRRKQRRASGSTPPSTASSAGAGPRVADEEIVERCWLQMLNETARCMEERIITNPADVDIGVIFGFGFPPFRGGLLREADRHGPRLGGGQARRLRREARESAWRPADLLRDMAARGATFYSSTSASIGEIRAAR